MLTAKAFKDLVSVNRYVNESVKPMTDLEHWGTIEKWSYPDDGYGDCEDYVLLKRRLLIQAGWPREALLITVVRDRRDEGHAVLTVKTDRGEFILDNQVEGILPWFETGYRFVKRQSQKDPNVWVSLGGPLPAPTTVARQRRYGGEVAEGDGHKRHMDRQAWKPLARPLIVTWPKNASSWQRSRKDREACGTTGQRRRRLLRRAAKWLADPRTTRSARSVGEHRR